MCKMTAQLIFQSDPIRKAETCRTEILIKRRRWVKNMKENRMYHSDYICEYSVFCFFISDKSRQYAITEIAVFKATTPAKQLLEVHFLWICITSVYAINHVRYNNVIMYWKFAHNCDEQLKNAENMQNLHLEMFEI